MSKEYLDSIYKALEKGENPPKVEPNKPVVQNQRLNTQGLERTKFGLHATIDNAPLSKNGLTPIMEQKISISDDDDDK